jgi:hypothetical protein
MLWRPAEELLVDDEDESPVNEEPPELPPGARVVTLRVPPLVLKTPTRLHSDHGVIWRPPDDGSAATFSMPAWAKLPAITRPKSGLGGISRE